MSPAQIAVARRRDGDPIQHVSDTSFWVAAYRALELERSDRLFYDPLAKILAGGLGEKIAQDMGNRAAMQWSVAIRTCIIDDYIQEAIRQGIDTVLNLGAGLDARPYRMEIPAALSWIEIDFPSVIEFKRRQLENETPRCRLERIELDLTDTDERRKIFSDINARAQGVVILTEGVLPYLSNEEVGSLAEDLGRHPHFRHWITDYFSSLFMDYYRRGRFRNRLSSNAPFRFDPDDWERFFYSRGWRLDHLRYLAEEGLRLGRRPPVPLLFKLMKPFLSRDRKRAVRQMSGYALLSNSVAQ